MAGSILGTRVLRTEDPELLDGRAKYVSDLDLGTNTVHAVFVRSELPHATVTNIDISDAVSAPGVVGVFVDDDLGIAPFQGFAKVHDDFARPALSSTHVRFVGDPIAVVVADTFAHAADAASMVVVDYDPLPAVIDPEDAVADGAPVLFDEHGDNVALTILDQPKADLFADADVIVRGRYVNQRLAVAPMEPHGEAAKIGDDGRLVVYSSTQMPHLFRTLLGNALGLDPKELHIVTPLVGGGFGGKAGLYAEQVVVAALAKRLERPVLWMSTRSEDMVALHHSRGQIQYVELGCKRDGTFTGLRVHLVGDAGAYPGIGAYLSGGTRRMSNGTYHFDDIQFDVVVAATNTTPMGAYRGAGRPEATAMLERAVGQAALELNIDPIELRRRNLLADDSFPFKTLTGLTYDSGAYTTPLDVAVKAVDYDAVRREQAERRRRGDRMLLGIGVSSYVEITAGGGASEYAGVEVNTDGTVTVLAGTSAHGQGHQTAFAMIVNSLTGIPVEKVRLPAVDTDEVRSGGGTGGSRSLQLGGSAVLRATEAMVDKAKQLAAHLLEADVGDIVVDTESGTVGVAGVPSNALDWAQLAAAAADSDAVDHSDGTTGLAAQLDFNQGEATFPFGTHISVVEVDQDTGKVSLLRHVAVDDCGTVLNPMLVEGQQHGGVAAGVSQALYENYVYDADGNPLTANFMDYALPSAAEFPNFDVLSTETPTPLNPLGAKGIGEASTIGSTPAVQNAIIDALAHLGVRHIDLPCTSEVVWQAIRDAEAGTLPDPWRDPPPVFARVAAAAAKASADTEDGVSAAEGI